jgi:O-antigen/teichoic acid export membrane protein
LRVPASSIDTLAQLVLPTGHNRQIDFRGADVRLASSSISKLGGGVALGSAVALLLSPILSRQYTPDAFGTLAVFTALSALVGAVAALRLDQAVIIARDDPTAASALGIGRIAAVVIGVVSIPLVLAAEPWVSRVLGDSSDDRTWFWLVGPCGSTIALYTLSNATLIRCSRHGRLGTRAATQMILQSAVPVATAAAAPGPFGLLLGFVISRPATVLALPAPSLARSPRVEWRNTFRRFRRFVTFSTPAAFINNCSQYLPVVAIAAAAGIATAGQYALAWRIMSVPAAIANQVASPIFNAAAASRARSDDSLLTLTITTTRRLAVLLAVPIVAVGILCPWLFPIVFGSTWKEAGFLAALFAPAAAMQAVAVPLSTLLDVLEAQRLNLAWDSVRLGALLALVTWWHYAVVGSTAVVVSLAVLQVVAYAAMIVIGLRLARSHHDRLSRATDKDE